MKEYDSGLVYEDGERVMYRGKVHEITSYGIKEISDQAKWADRLDDIKMMVVGAVNLIAEDEVLRGVYELGQVYSSLYDLVGEMEE